MTSPAAIRAAIELKHLPSQVHAVRGLPLPDGTTLLLRIAAGEDAAQSEAMKFTGRSAEVVRTASEFFIEQVLLFSEADSYRVLGGLPDASVSDLRHHMALLLRWLHPDVDPDGQRSLMAARVIKAWENLKTPERRAIYDASPNTIGVQRTNTLHGDSKLSRRKKRRGPPPAGNRQANPKPDDQMRPRHSVLRKAIAFLMGQKNWE